VSFINDIIVGIEEEKGHDEIIEVVVKRLAENNLYVKLEKCKWKVREVEFLEEVKELERIKIKEVKVKRVLNWLTPKEVKYIQKFLGLANYYQWFIKYLTTIARPLHDLVKKDQKWNWIKKQGNMFKKLKERFIKELVLAVPDLAKKIRMEVNVLGYAMEGVLSMKCESGQ